MYYTGMCQSQKFALMKKNAIINIVVHKIFYLRFVHIFKYNYFNIGVEMKIRLFNISWLAFLIFGFQFIRAELNIDPFGFGIRVVDEPRQINLALHNVSDSLVQYAVRARWLRDRVNQNAGPRRDPPGQVLGEFVPPGGAVQHYNVGLAWDEENRWMWNNDFHTGRCWALNPDNEFRPAREFAVLDRCMSTALLNDHLYMVVDPQAYLTHYNRAGQRLDNVGFNFTTFAVTMSTELGLLFVMGNDGGIHIYRMRDNGMLGDEVGAIRNWAGFLNNAPCRSMLWVDLHIEGQLWMNGTRGLNNEAGNWAYQLTVDTERWEVTARRQTFRTRDGQSPQHWDGLGHDGENLWASFWMIQQIYIIDDGMAEVRLISINPNNGELRPDEDEELEITIDPGRSEPGVYNHNLEFTLTEGGDESTMVVSVVVTVEDAVCTLSGQVADASNDQPIQDAQLAMNTYTIVRTTDNEGRYSFAELPPAEYRLTVEAPDFLTQLVDVNLEDEQQELNIALLHATCEPDVEEIFNIIESNDTLNVSFNVQNNGNGPLTYRVERRLLGEANAEPWELRRSFAVGNLLGDDRIEGVAFDGDSLYLVGAAGDNPNVVYVITREGEPARQFVQPGQSNYGMKDLEWDGELLWGSGEARVFGFDRAGDVQIQFNGPYATNQAIAFDPVNNILWIAAMTNNIVGYDRQGQALNRVLNRRSLRIYGLAYWADDPDGYPLYILHSPGNNELWVHKMRVDNGDTLRVTQLPTVGSPGGAYITSQFDVYSWVFMSIANIPRGAGNDRVDIYQLEGRKEWFNVLPAEGIIEAGEAQEFTLHFDSHNLPLVRFEGELAFIHDGVGSLTRIPVTLEVTDVRIPVNRFLNFRQGWNLVSANLQPDRADVRIVMRPLVEADQLLLMKNSIGQFYAPRVDFCNIPGWMTAQGYFVKVTMVCQLPFRGTPVRWDEPIPLHQGWNIAAYYPRMPFNERTALAGIIDHLIIAKDGMGNFYIPARNFSNMPPMCEGQGYQIKVDEDVELVYRLQQNQAAALQPPAVSAYSRTDIPQVAPTGKNMSLLLMENGKWIAPGAVGRASLPAESTTLYEGEILVYAGDLLVGSGWMENGVCGIAVWGDDPTTDALDGAIEGEELQIVNCKMNSKFQIPNSKFVYRTDGFEIIDLMVGGNACPTKFEIEGVYPNPFNAATQIKFNMPEAGMVKSGLFDLSGRLVLDLGAEHWLAGSHRLALNGGSLASGIYILQMEAGGKTAQMKAALVK